MKAKVGKRQLLRAALIGAIGTAVAGSVLAETVQWRPWSPGQERPGLPGERYEAVTPDTLDLTCRAELAINAITGVVDVEEPANGEIWIANVLNATPPYMIHLWGVAGVHQPKVSEPLAAMRVMTGSAANLGVEKKMVDWMIKGLSKDDGLLYALAKPDRPWYSFDCEWGSPENSRINGPGTQAPGNPIPGGDTDYAYIYGQARALKFMLAYYQYTRDPLWKDRIDKMIEGIDKKMAFHGTDPGTGREYAYMPFGGGVNHTDRKPLSSDLGSCMPRSGWKETAREPGSEVESSNEGSVFMDIGPYPGVLARWYAMSGSTRALELAGEFENFMMQKKFWGTDKDPMGRERGAELGHWEGHFFGRVEALLGLLEYAIVTNDAALKEFVRGAYEWTKNSNLWPSFSKPVAPIPAIGFFDTHCGCTTPRMIALAIKLSDAGVGDYWEDVDRWIRNNAVEVQTVDRTLLEKVVEGKPASVIRPLIDSGDRVIERTIGGYAISTKSPTEILGPSYTWDSTCCLPHGSWALYYAWEGIVRCDKDVAAVNLMLNRASPWLDVDSYLPYEGKVVIHNKTAKTLLLRIPQWVNKQAVRCKRNGKSVNFAWAGNRLLIEGLGKKDTITVEFPMVERTEKHYKYTFTFKGNTVVDVSPREHTGGYPIYLRDSMKADKAPMKKVTRYVAPRLIKW